MTISMLHPFHPVQKRPFRMFRSEDRPHDQLNPAGNQCKGEISTLTDQTK